MKSGHSRHSGARHRRLRTTRPMSSSRGSIPKWLPGPMGAVEVIIQLHFAI